MRGGTAEAATMQHSAAPCPAQRQLGDVVPRANPFPKGFLFSSLSCWLWMGPCWLGGCLRAGFWGQQGLVCSAVRCRSAHIAALCQRAEQQGHSLAGPCSPRIGFGAALVPCPAAPGFGGCWE